MHVFFKKCTFFFKNAYFFLSCGRGLSREILGKIRTKCYQFDLYEYQLFCSLKHVFIHFLGDLRSSRYFDKVFKMLIFFNLWELFFQFDLFICIKVDIYASIYSILFLEGKKHATVVWHIEMKQLCMPGSIFK